MSNYTKLRSYWQSTLWSRGLPAQMRIGLLVGWPLFLLPLLLFSQIVTPHPVWVVLLVVLIILYLAAYLWVRRQVQAVNFDRRREGSVLVAGDLLHEEFILTNRSPLPVLWAEWEECGRAFWQEMDELVVMLDGLTEANLGDDDD